MIELEQLLQRVEANDTAKEESAREVLIVAKSVYDELLDELKKSRDRIEASESVEMISVRRFGERLEEHGKCQPKQFEFLKEDSMGSSPRCGGH